METGLRVGVVMRATKLVTQLCCIRFLSRYYIDSYGQHRSFSAAGYGFIFRLRHMKQVVFLSRYVFDNVENSSLSEFTPILQTTEYTSPSFRNKRIYQWHEKVDFYKWNIEIKFRLTKQNICVSGRQLVTSIRFIKPVSQLEFLEYIIDHMTGK